MTGKRKKMYICPECKKECRGSWAFEMHFRFKHSEIDYDRNQIKIWKKVKVYKINR